MPRVSCCGIKILQIEQVENRIELFPVDSWRNQADFVKEGIDRIMQEAEGFLKGIDTQ